MRSFEIVPSIMIASSIVVNGGLSAPSSLSVFVWLPVNLLWFFDLWPLWGGSYQEEKRDRDSEKENERKGGGSKTALYILRARFHIHKFCQLRGNWFADLIQSANCHIRRLSNLLGTLILFQILLLLLCRSFSHPLPLSHLLLLYFSRGLHWNFWLRVFSPYLWLWNLSKWNQRRENVKILIKITFFKRSTDSGLMMTVMIGKYSQIVRNIRYIGLVGTADWVVRAWEGVKGKGRGSVGPITSPIRPSKSVRLFAYCWRASCG